ncbi:response regulator [Marinilabilia rubra]|uniref:Response regulator n=1 Tax=Marinilabilia rubra TaxID=2162893 RepID=A0A2U2BD50_9BACT|nr:response regulator [Marinilabilia rubra]PWE00963.1 response regulator [Marinilabilia rubra]
MARILVCEDDKLLSRIIERILCGENHEVTLVTDGNSAIDKLRLNHFDLIVSDINMPGKSGMQIVYFIRNIIQLPTPILLTSASSNSDQVRRAKKRGANDFLPKPFAVDRLKRKTNQLLQNHKRLSIISA